MAGLAVLVVGCDEQTSSSGVASATATAVVSAASSKELAQLKATVNGEPLALQTAVAFSRGGRGLELVFSTATPECKDFAGNGRMLADGEQHFSVTIGPLLGKDGKESWGIGRLYFDSHTQQGGDLGTVRVSSADPKAGVKGELSFDLQLEANEFMKKPARKLEVKGPFTAEGCGTFEREDAPAARPQSKLKLTVAGKPIPIQSALVEPTTFPDPGHDLILSTAPASCGKRASDADLTVKLNVAEGGRVQYAFAAGNLLSSQLNASPGKEGPTISATADGSLDGEGEVTITLDGELDVVGYAIAASGELVAQRCPPKM
ncbi:MAG TPA: hypothetical protein ENK57_22870 [Polyangiaceae bacterium]|nr:hypothetical protein [Polyangiaceae bacterium]